MKHLNHGSQDKEFRCTCSTGHFCPIHGRFGGVLQAPVTTRDEVNITHQKCGGGRRIIRKKIGGIE